MTELAESAYTVAMVEITSAFLHTKLREIKRRVLAGEVFELTHYGEPTGIVVSQAPGQIAEQTAPTKVAGDE